MVTSCVQSLHAQEVADVVTELMQRYPQDRLLDIYKSCFQDCMGAEHLVEDVESARAYLEREIASIDAAQLASWYYEPCGIKGRYVRVSLKAVIDGKVSTDALLDAFVRSANDPGRPSVEQWADQWRQIVDTIDRMNLGLPHYDEDKRFIDQVLKQGKYAISHSPEYREAYSPHYRIIRRDIFDKELKGLMTTCRCCHAGQ